MASHQVDKFKGLREDGIKKIGLRIGAKKLSHLQDRQIRATKATPNPPISALALEQFNHDTRYQPQKGLQPDFGKTPMIEGTRSVANF